MSTVGASIVGSIVQAAGAQAAAAHAKDRERNAMERDRRYDDLLDLTVHRTEGPEPVRRLPSNDSEQAGQEHRYGSHRPAGRPRIDLQA